MADMELPKEIYVQIDDVDGEDVYYTASERRGDMPFRDSDRHPVGKYVLVEGSEDKS